MKIGFEGQVFCSGAKTGVGWYSYNIIKAVIEMDRANIYELNIFDFLGRKKSRWKVRDLFSDRDVRIRESRLIHYFLFARHQELFRNISYNAIFGSTPDICHFFNFILPMKIESRTVSTVHDMTFIRFPETMTGINYQIHKKELKRSCQAADRIIAVSRFTKSEILQFMGVSEEKIEIASPAVDRTCYYPDKKPEVLKDRFGIKKEYILYLGTLEPRKNIPAIIKAFSILSEKNRDIDLVLAGGNGWKNKEIFELIRSCGLDDRVICTGYVSVDEARYLYSSARLFVFPSLYEGFGMSPLEAMACGAPVIVSNTASLPEVVGDAGVLIDPKDTDHFAFEMARFISDNEHHRVYSLRGIERVKSYTWEKSARKVIEVYNILK